MSVKNHKRVPLMVIIFKDKSFYCWQKYKTQMQYKQYAPFIWEEFKLLLRKKLGKFDAFVTCI